MGARRSQLISASKESTQVADCFEDEEEGIICTDVVEADFDESLMGDDSDDDAIGSYHQSSTSASVPSPRTETEDPLETLARLQSFDGCFSAAVFDFVSLKTDIDVVRALFPAGAGDAIVATVLAMAFLCAKLSADVERESWEGMYEKAKEYVKEALVSMGANVSVEALEAKAMKMLA
jgi:hypothetical protein